MLWTDGGRSSGSPSPVPLMSCRSEVLSRCGCSQRSENFTQFAAGQSYRRVSVHELHASATSHVCVPPMKNSEVDDDGELVSVRQSFNVEVICRAHSSRRHQTPKTRINPPSPRTDV